MSLNYVAEVLDNSLDLSGYILMAMTIEGPGFSKTKTVGVDGPQKEKREINYVSTDTPAHRAMSAMNAIRRELYTASCLFGTLVDIGGTKGIMIRKGADSEKFLSIFAGLKAKYKVLQEEYLTWYLDSVEEQARKFPEKADEIRGAAPSLDVVRSRFKFHGTALQLGSIQFDAEDLQQAIETFPMGAAREIAAIVRKSVSTPFGTDSEKARVEWMARVYNAGNAKDLLNTLIEKINRVSKFHKSLELWPDALREKLALIPAEGRLDAELNASLKVLYERMLQPEKLLDGPVLSKSSQLEIEAVKDEAQPSSDPLSALAATQAPAETEVADTFVW